MDTLSARGSGRNAVAAHCIVPSGIDAYFDKVGGWLRQPVSDRTHARLCDLGAEFPYRAPRFTASNWQAIHLHRPDPEALQLLDSPGQVHLNYGEFALDLTFADQLKKLKAEDWTDRHLIRKYHPSKYGIRWVKGVTRYDAPRSAQNGITLYTDRASRITGELACLHVEWRCNGVAALRRIGINSVADLLTFDHRAFWQQRLILQDWSCDPKVLGRIYNRHIGPAGMEPRRGRREWIDYIGTNKFAYSVDVRAGAIIQDMPVQRALDYYRKLQIDRYLQPINVEQLFPMSLYSDWGGILYEPTYPVNSKANSPNLSW
jgi:hypothetical protein